MTGALTLYDNMCRAIEEAHRIDELKSIHDDAKAREAAARIAKNTEAEQRLREIRERAERRLGEIMGDQRDAGLLKPGNPNFTSNGSNENPLAEKPITLAETGIDKGLADRARKAARMPTEEFEKKVKRPIAPRKPRQSKPVPASTRSHRRDIPKMVGSDAQRNSEACIEAEKRKLVAAVGPVDDGNPILVTQRLIKSFVALGNEYQFLTGRVIADVQKAVGLADGFAVARNILQGLEDG